MPTPATNAANALSDTTLTKVVERSKRWSGLQLPPSFVRDPKAFDPPLAKMLRGGHGGEVRLKLFLTMALLAGEAPHTIRPISARTWATALGLSDPEKNGARRIADALRWLADEQHPLVKLERVSGAPPTVQLLSASGSGKVWTRPTQPYVTLPIAYWTQRWIWTMSGSATALLLILLDEHGRLKGKPATFSGDDRKLRGLSDDTWSRATSELKKHGLLDIGRATDGEELDWRRVRNSYLVHKERLSEPASEDTVVARP
jgi:hypothetical protein